MGFCCFYKPDLVMESVTRKGREACLEPSQFHDLFSFMEVSYGTSGKEIDGAGVSIAGL